jgi:LuxR family maltose regulon positive regulatory protein
MSHARQRNDADGVAVEAARLFDGPEALDAELDDHVRGLALVTIGISETLAGDPASGEGHLGRALDIARRLHRPYLELGTLTFLALACGARSPQLAEQYSREAIAIVDANGWQEEPVAAMGYVTLGVDRLWRARLGEAERWLELAQRAIGRETEPVTGFTLESAVGRLALLRGDPGSALRAFGQALRFGERLLSPHSLAPGTIAHMLVARLRAGAIQDAVDELAAMDDSVRARPELKVASAALALALDGPEAAIDVFGPGGARELGATHRWQTQALLIEAAAHGALGDAGASTRALESALDLAEPDGLLLPFLLFGDRELLERHRRSRTTHAALLADALTLLSGRDLDPLAADVEPLSEPLSESELRVLRYLPTNLRVPEIASELFVSPNTARTHIRRIYLKLGVHDRGEAVARGRDLGLLGPGAHLR